jgi:acetone carboxylase gamma subunit
VPAGAETIGDVYVVDRSAGTMSCHRCDTKLCGLREDPKQAMVAIERPVQSLAPGRPDARQYVDDDVVWRDLCCPGCGVRLATEVAYPGDPTFREIEIH